MHCIICHVEEKGAVEILGRDDTLCLSRNQIRYVTRFLQRLFVTMPVVDRKMRRGMVQDHFGRIVDAPRVVSVLMVETTLQRQVFFFPFAKMPLPGDGGVVARFP